LVPVEQDAQEDAKYIFDAMNKAMTEIGGQQFTERDQVEAVIYIVVRKERNGGAFIGRISTAEIMRAVLEFLVDTDVITYEFGAKILAEWAMNKLAAHP
jgi:predicted transcriptional regulator